MPEKTLNHFSCFKLSEAFFGLTAQKRAAFFSSLAGDLQAAKACSNFYQVSPMRADVDLLIWNAYPLEKDGDEAAIFDGLGKVLTARRPYLQPVMNYWGYTRPSVYSRAPSAQEIDPFAAQRQPFLVLYPFVKTIQWYLLGKDTRQGMMNEHIRVGHQYPEIMQLLLYSFGVQDQEFIVVYETANLYRFSELVNELRGSDVRLYTERDTPVYTGVWKSVQDISAIFA